MTGPPIVLLLGGSTEATAIAAELGRRSEQGSVIDLVVSFAGRTAGPMVPFGRTRVGGFGGVPGLTRYLRNQHVTAVIDALHPFAAVMPFHAHEGAIAADTPLVKVVRPPWTPQPGDRWRVVASMAEAPAAVAAAGARRALLTIGRQELDPFRSVDDIGFVVRSIEPADLSGVWDATELLDRGPFTVDEETALFERQRIDLVVTKNSGGSATSAKLEAARRLGLPVVIVDRPPLPPVGKVTSVEEAVAWLDRVLAAQPSG